MPVITIREGQQTDFGFTATLSFDGRVNFPVEISQPFGLAEEARLEWYFEDWLRYPMLDTVKATEAAASVKAYGEQLFQQIFKTNLDAYVEYNKVRGNLKDWRIEIEGSSPEFQGLHWEALRDRDLPRPLAVDCVMVRKSNAPTAIAAVMQPSPTINLLMVTARPSRNDVGYRTISRPLIELLENSQLRVNVDLLRPATFEALTKHLEDKGAGYYHIIHFDAHGALLTYDEFSQPSRNEASSHLFKERYGRSAITKYDGVKAFVAMESEIEDCADLVEATELANLLTGKRIPVCILNACQSGKQLGAEAVQLVGQGEDYRETSLGSRLMASGMQMVVAMGYSVTVTAAQVMMEQLYRSLFERKSLEDAIRLGRLELFNRKERQAYFNQRIPLEDWLLPVVYGNRTVDFNLCEFTPITKEKYAIERHKKYKFSKPEYDFFGRDLDILKIEKALLRHNFLLLQGMGGTGKTTLLKYLHEWWQTTNFTKLVFYFGYDQKAWTVEQLVQEIGVQLFDRLDDFHRFMPEAKEQEVIDKLRTESHILILDNLESVTGQRLAIKNTLSKPKQAKLRDFLARLLGVRRG